MDSHPASEDEVDDATRDVIALIRAHLAHDHAARTVIEDNCDLITVTRIAVATAVTALRVLAARAGVPADARHAVIAGQLDLILTEVNRGGFSRPDGQP